MAPPHCQPTLLEYDGDLIMGGWFTSIGDQQCNGIARWDGQQWLSMNGGMTKQPRPLSNGTDDGDYSGSVQSLLVYNGDLLAGGWFEAAGNVTTNGVARWDGQQWHAIGAGLEGTSYPGGLFTPPYCDPASVNALAIYRGRLYAGGYFNIAGDDTSRRLSE